MAENRVLVVSPHADDEMLGCGGLLLRLAALGNAECFGILVCGSSFTSRHRGEEVSHEVLQREFQRSCMVLNMTCHKMLDFPNAALDQVPRRELVGHLDDALQDLKPNVVLFPEPSTHIDHLVVHDSMLAALRPSRRAPVESVLRYEVPTSDVGSGFRPNLFIDIGGCLEQKVKLFESVYKSQLTAPGAGRSGTEIRAHAQHRGFQGRCEAAEAFEVVRWRW